jgi:hypothetical protein
MGGLQEVVRRLDDRVRAHGALSEGRNVLADRPNSPVLAICEREPRGSLAEAECEAAETQTWVAYVVKCGYLSRTDAIPLHRAYEEVLRMIVAMTKKAELWVIRTR